MALIRVVDGTTETSQQLHGPDRYLQGGRRGNSGGGSGWWWVVAVVSYCNIGGDGGDGGGSGGFNPSQKRSEKMDKGIWTSRVIGNSALHLASTSNQKTTTATTTKDYILPLLPTSGSPGAMQAKHWTR